MFSLIKNTYRMVASRERKTVLENFFSLSGLQAINYLIPIIILPYLIRVVGPDKFGLIAFAQALTQYFLILTDYGFNFSATREISLCREQKNKISEIFSAVMLVKITLCGIAYLILLLLVSFVPRFRQDWLVYLLSFGTVFGTTLFPAWFFQGIERMKYIAVLNTISNCAAALGILLLVKSPADYLHAPAVTSAASIAAGIIAMCIATFGFKAHFAFRGYKEIRRQLAAGWNVFASIIAINAYTTTRVFAMGLLTNNTLTGFYSIAERISGAIQTFPLSSFSQAVYPRLSKIYLRSQKKAAEIMHKIQRITLLLATIILPVIYILAPWIVDLVCGVRYEGVVITLRILILSLLFINANAFKVQFLLVCGRSDLYLRIHLAMASVGLPLIFFSIASFSYVGAALSTLITEMGIFILTSRRIKELSVR